MLWWRWGTSRGAAVIVAILALATAGAVVVGAPVPSAAAKSKHKKKPPPFCTNPADNYKGPLEKLQPMPTMPEGGLLPFAPTIAVTPTGPQGVLVGGSNIGFRLTNTAPGPGARRLNWTVLERLVRLTKEGTVLHPVAMKRLNLGRLPAGQHRGLTFPLPSTPAVYSLEVTIQNHRGRLLGRYGEYVRIVDRTVNVGMTLAAYDNVKPGADVESCFENHGSATVMPLGTSLERSDNGIWKPVVVGPQYSPAQTTIQRSLGPGESEKIGTLVPPDAYPGLYKLTATGLVVDSGETIAVSAEFGVE